MSWAGEVARLEGHLYVARALMDRDGIGIEEALNFLGSLVPEEDHEAVILLWQSQSSRTITILEPAVLSEGGPQPWAREWDSSKGYYWPRQRIYLRSVQHRTDYEIDSLDRSSDRVLAHLGDPNSPSGFNVRGLVMGYVQSGKTANFSALIAKAVDAGYKIVVVLSGLHNTLRHQTQVRLQRDLGHEETLGVGPPESTRVWVWMTGPGVNGDFSPAGQNAGVLQGNNQVILVVKKNKTRLDRLIAWMQNKVPPHVPVLVIDDEADLASINTRGNRLGLDRPGYEEDIEQTDLTREDLDGDFTADELDPSAINMRIRQLLQLFVRCSYVAYTATPFANVLIDPDITDIEAGEELFPRDFIISLPKPPGDTYVGAERLFGRDQLPGDTGQDVEPLDVIEIVQEHEVTLLVPPRRSRERPTIPPSLEQALRDYLIASAAWLNRAGRDVPCTMLVHTDMRKALQDAIADEIQSKLAMLRQEWRYDQEGRLRSELEQRWESHFRPRSASVSLAWDTPFAQIEPYLNRLLSDGVVVRRLNSDHADTADFDEEPTLKAVLVGGNKLSRGVTLEGLLVSYYVRLVPYYDTLLQMGRWFGYRGEYVDITRLYSTQKLVSWFHDLATAEEDLRRQIELYDRDNLTPLQFAPRIRNHPAMLVTAENKMRDAREISQSYDGELVQTLRFPFGDPALVERMQANLEYTRQMLSSLGPPNAAENGLPGWHGVGADFVGEVLDNLWVMEQTAIHPPTVRSYIRAQTLHDELMRWRVLVSAQRSPREDLGREDLGIQEFGEIGLINRSRLAKDPTSLGVITNPDDELFGLSANAISEAREAFENRQYPTLGKAYRSQRDPREGLLILYPISGNSVPGFNAQNRIGLFETGQQRCTIIGYAVSFPCSKSPATVTYIQGPESRRR